MKNRFLILIAIILVILSFFSCGFANDNQLEIKSKSALLLSADTGEVLYQSKLIAPGKAVLEIKLSRPLPAGDYALLIGIDSFSLADGTTPMNGGEQKVLLKVR